ncbi:MAG: shikimate kinase [Lachnospiraceae bacterium]|nr:shikimate kinase [Lachnospiraceae bacterium]
MPGVGKSTIGVVLAKLIGYQFIDADLVIQQKAGKLLHEIIKEEGTDGFLEIEGRINSEIEAERAIIATGGSVVYEKNAMEHYKKTGIIVYLHVSFPILEKRLKDIKGRGVVLKSGQDLQALYAERTPLYESYADIVVEEENMGVEDTVEALIEKLRQIQE